jgi:hypothetical protein
MALTIGCGITLGVGVLALVAGATAEAQQPRRGETVTQRQRSDLDPLGVRAGGFLVYPELAVSEKYSDNTFATPSGRKDDFITDIEPKLRVQSDWNRHSLALTAGADVGRFASNSREDFEDINVNLNGRADVLRDRYLLGNVSWSKLHEDRGSPDDVNGATPTEYTLLAPSIGAFNKWNRFSLRGDVALQRLDYDDVNASSGTATINNDDRDRTQYIVTVRAGYEIVPEYEGFVRGSWNTIDYREAVDDAGFDRDSDGYEVVAGTRIDFSGVTFGDVFAGYRRQSHDDALLNNVSGLSYGGAITWNASGLTTFKGSVTRTVEETTLSTSSGSFLTEVRASVDHELLRNLLVGGTFSYRLNDYEGIAREDDEYRAGAYARYLMHRNLYLTARYDFEKRESNAVGADYDKNIFLIRLETQL